MVNELQNGGTDSKYQVAGIIKGILFLFSEGKTHGENFS
jgi:hypothetical protein